MGSNQSCTFWRCDPGSCALSKTQIVRLTTSPPDVPPPALACLRHAAFFRGLREEECGELLAGAKQRRYAKDEFIFRSGDLVTRFWLLRSGRVKLLTSNSQGDEVIVRIIPQGEVLDSLQHGEGEHRWGALSWGGCEIVSWDVKAFRGFVRRFPVLQENLTKTLTERLQHLEERYCELASERVSVRVARMLVRLATQIGRDEDGTIELEISRQELAQLTGTTMFTASRLLSAWETQGIMSSKRGSILLTDFDRLVELINQQSETTSMSE